MRANLLSSTVVVVAIGGVSTGWSPQSPQPSSPLSQLTRARSHEIGLAVTDAVRRYRRVHRQWQDASTDLARLRESILATLEPSARALEVLGPAERHLDLQCCGLDAPVLGDWGSLNTYRHAGEAVASALRETPLAPAAAAFAALGEHVRQIQAAERDGEQAASAALTQACMSGSIRDLVAAARGALEREVASALRAQAQDVAAVARSVTALEPELGEIRKSLSSLAGQIDLQRTALGRDLQDFERAAGRAGQRATEASALLQTLGTTLGQMAGAPGSIDRLGGHAAATSAVEAGRLLERSKRSVDELSVQMQPWFAGLTLVPFDVESEYMCIGYLATLGCSGTTGSCLGTNGTDVIEGTPGADVILGHGGDDFLDGKPTSWPVNTDPPDDTGDVICGGQGVDDIDGWYGDDKLYGEDGDDFLKGRTGIDHLLGGQGDDDLHGGDAGDTLEGGPGKDYLSGGPGTDILRGGSDNDTLSGNEDNDQLSGDHGADWLFGGPGDDTLSAGVGGTADPPWPTILYGSEIVCGGPTADHLEGQAGTDTLLGDAGHDWLGGFDGQDDDVLSGSAGRDCLMGGAGSDILIGGDDRDWLVGNDGNDQLWGDRLFGDVGDADWLWGDLGTDAARGGAGNDLVDGGPGGDVVEGGVGDDTLFGDNPCTVGPPGNDTLTGGTGDDGMNGNAGTDQCDGGSDADTAINCETVTNTP